MRKLFVAVLAATCAACSPDRGPEELVAASFEDEVVLDAVLIVGRPVPRIYLTRTISPTAAFPADLGAESGAQISILRGGREVAAYREIPGTPGQYDPDGPFPHEVVRPQARYEILVVTQDGRRITGETRTPPRFQVEDWLLLEDDAVTVRRNLGTFEEHGSQIYANPANQVQYADGLLEARFLRPDVTAFQVAVVNLEQDSPFVIDPDFFSEEDFEMLDRELSSPPLQSEDGMLRLPWLAIYFEGRTLIRILAIDDNWYDLIRSTPGLDANGGGVAFGGNAGEGFERPLFRLEGGIGIFGSASVDSVGFFVEPAGP